MSSAVTPEMMDSEIRSLLKQGDQELARKYISFAETRAVEINPSLQDAAKDDRSILDRWAKSGRGIAAGMSACEGNSPEAIAGVLAADLISKCDVEDLNREIHNYVDGKKVNKVVAGLSALGITLTAATVLSMGTGSGVTVPGKMGAALLKLAIKTGSISKGLVSKTGLLLRKAFDFDGMARKVKELKGSDKLDLTQWEGLIKSHVRSDKVVEIENIFGSVATINKTSGSLTDTLKIIKIAKNSKELKSLSKLTETYAEHAFVVLRILGKNAVKVIKYSIKAIYALCSVVISVVWFFCSLILSNALRRRIFKKAAVPEQS